MENINIFVPSKARVNNASLLKLAEKEKENITVVVEPQDFPKYVERYPNFNYIKLPKDNGGLGYVRNFIQEYTEKQGLDNYWQLDDDITTFYYRQGSKLIKAGFEVLAKAQQQFIKNGIALGALEYSQFAWSASKELVTNSYCDVCVFFDNKKISGLRFREFLEGKVDRDFTMQVIKNGHKSGRTTLYAFSAPKNGSNSGGLKEIFYDLGREELSVLRMVEVWGEEICTPIVKRNGRKDVKIMWKKINSNQMSLF